MNFWVYILIGISLSIDAFSVALAIGTTNPSKKIIYLQPIIVGVFHFIMPVIGNYISLIFVSKIVSKTNIIIAIIFFVLAIEIYQSKDTPIVPLIKNTFTIIIISLTVSLDSLLVGLVLSLKEINIYLMASCFSLISFLFTLTGINLGIRLRYKYHKLAIYIGIIILIALAIKYLLG